MPPTPDNITIKFDFRAFVPNQDLSSGTVQIDGGYCADKSFPIVLLAENLTPGNKYRTNYELLIPATENRVFNPSSSDLYASYGSQNFLTTAVLPKGPNKESNTYILKATLTDITEGAGGTTASTQIKLICGIDRQIFDVELIDPDSISDETYNIGNCDDGFPLIGKINNALLNKEYNYEFFDIPVGSMSFERKIGSVFAGDSTQNFNSRVALTGYPYAFVHAKVTEKDTGITRISDPLLLKCFQTDECSVVLPTGINYTNDVRALFKCSSLGISNESIKTLYGGKGFSVGDKLTTTGGGGYGAEIQVLFGGITTDTFSSFSGGSGFNINDLIEVTGGGGSGGLIKIISGGLTLSSINSLTGCAGFKVGDLLTTVGGGGEDALISVTATGVNGSISSYSLINSGYGFIDAPTGVVSVNGQGSCAYAVFNSDNFTIPAAGGITLDSLKLQGGTGYNIGEILNIVGGGGTGAQIKIISGSLTAASINSLLGGTGYAVGDYLTTTGGGGSDVVIKITAVGPNGEILAWEILNAGYGFTSAPTGLISLTGVGSGASLVANADNFSITSEGGITKDSIKNLIGSGVGYTVGDQLIAVGGDGSGAIIVITAVSATGAILDYIIKNAGSGYDSAPQLLKENQTPIVPQPSWNIDKFTDKSFVIINAGSGYVNPPSDIISTNGNGGGASVSVDITQYTKPAFIVVNTGSGYTSAPTGILVKSGDGSGASASFNDKNFTIPCAGGITYESISGLIGKTSFINGEELVVDGGSGTGGRLKITSVNNGAIVSFVVLNSGCGYTEAPILKKLNGTVVSLVSFNVDKFTDLAVVVTNPGAGFVDIPTGIAVLTGSGNTNSILVDFDANKFVELAGEIPDPPIPTPTVTPSPSRPVLCNDLQTAGGQNTVSQTQTINSASIGQNFIIVEDNTGLNQYSVVEAPGIAAGTYITKITNWFSDFNNRILYKKITLNNNLSLNIPANTSINIYTADIRLIKVPYWPGNMTFTYNAYSVPDRFRVFAVPMDSRLPDILLFDSGYRGDDPCGYASNISGLGFGQTQLTKPDGCVYVKVVVEAPCEGTAWEYSLSCPERIFTTISSTPTRTPTLTPTITVTPSRSSG